MLLSVLSDLQQSPNEGTVQVFKHKSHYTWSLTSGSWLSEVLLLPMKQISEVVCFLQAFGPELCFADLTTVSVFIYKTLAPGVYEIDSFLCSILRHDLYGHCPVAFIFSPPSSWELPRVYLPGAMVLLIFKQDSCLLVASI